MSIDTVFQIMSQNLAVKAAAMNSYKELHAMAASLAKEADHSTIPEKIRTKVRTVIQISNEKAYRQLRSKTKLSMIPVNQQIFALRDGYGVAGLERTRLGHLRGHPDRCSIYQHGIG
jgi:hypothetical protein